MFIVLSNRLSAFRKHIFSKNKFLKYQKLNSLCYDDESEYEYNKRKNANRDINYLNFIPTNDFSSYEYVDDYETLYTLIWYDCEESRELLADIKKANIKILYIDGSYYFFDEDDDTNTPIFYKNDQLIATDVFSIYEELFNK